MDTKRQTDLLGDYVREVRRAKGLSLTDVQRASRNEITASYVSLIENGRVENPGVGKLRALARGLALTEEEVFSVARGSVLAAPDAQESQLLAFYRGLPRPNQDDLMAIAKTLHRERGIAQVAQIKTTKRQRAA